MGLIGINSVTPYHGPSTLDKIAEGVQIANGVLGVALKIPEYLQGKNAAANASAESTININQNSTPTAAGQKADFVSHGQGRTVTPSLDQQIKQHQVDDFKPVSQEAVDNYVAKSNGRLKPADFTGMSLGAADNFFKNTAQQSVTDRGTTYNNIMQAAQPLGVDEKGVNHPLKKGWSERIYPEYGITKPIQMPDAVGTRIEINQNHENDQKNKQELADEKTVQNYAAQFISGNRGSQLTNQLGIQVMGIQRAEDTLDKVSRGELTDNNSILHALGDDYTRVMTGGAGAGEDRKIFIHPDLVNKYANLMSIVQSKPESVQSPSFRQQLQSTLDQVRSTVYQQYSNKADANGILMTRIFENPKYGKRLADMYFGSLLANMGATGKNKEDLNNFTNTIPNRSSAAPQSIGGVNIQPKTNIGGIEIIHK